MVRVAALRLATGGLGEGYGPSHSAQQVVYVPAGSCSSQSTVQ